MTLIEECDGWMHKYQDNKSKSNGQMQDIAHCAETALHALHNGSTAVVAERLEIILSKARAYQL